MLADASAGTRALTPYGKEKEDGPGGGAGGGRHGGGGRHHDVSSSQPTTPRSGRGRSTDTMQHSAVLQSLDAMESKELLELCAGILTHVVVCVGVSGGEGCVSFYPHLLRLSSLLSPPPLPRPFFLSLGLSRWCTSESMGPSAPMTHQEKRISLHGDHL